MTTLSDRSPENGIAGKIWRVGSLTYTSRTLALLFLWLLGGDFALAVRDRAIPPVMQIMFKNFGASDMLTGLIFSSIPAALGLFIVPILSFKSDRLRTRFGRRIPFLFFLVPFIVLATIGLAFSPLLGKGLSDLLGRWSPGTAPSALILMSISWIVFEIGCIAAYPIFGALLNDVVPHTVMGRFFGFYRAISLVAGILFFYHVLAKAQSHFTGIFLGIGAIYGIAFALVCLKVKEGELPRIVDSTGPPAGIFAAVITYFRDGFGNPYYLWFFAATILGNLGCAPFNLFSVYYSESLGMSDSTYFKCIAWSYFISLFLSVPLGMAADRFHPLRLTMVMLLLYGSVMAFAGFLVQDAASFAVALLVHTVISGSLITSWASLSQRLLPRARFAEISSAGGMIGSVIGIFFAPLLGRFLDLTHHAYRYTFFISAELIFGALVAFFILHHRFMALGGPTNYRAPE